MAPGLYHYDPDRHGLRRVASASRASVKRYLPVQDSFADAAAVFFMTAVYPRVQWKYRSPRAYRVVLIEAGHLCQTFCLVATWLGLAPFCTAALADSIIESYLGVDGLTESVLYAAGVGRPPAGTAWAPFADRQATLTAEPLGDAGRPPRTGGVRDRLGRSPAALPAQADGHLSAAHHLASHPRPVRRAVKRHRKGLDHIPRTTSTSASARS